MRTVKVVYRSSDSLGAGVPCYDCVVMYDTDFCDGYFRVSVSVDNSDQLTHRLTEFINQFVCLGSDFNIKLYKL